MAQHQSGTSGGKSAQGQGGTQGQETSGQHGASQGGQGMQPGTSSMQGTSGSQGRGTHTQGQTGLRGGDGNTGIDNITYDLISVAYHALQGVQTYQQYEQDATRGNDEVSEFLRRVCDDNKQCAQEALRLLQQCLGGQGTQGGQSMQHGQSTQGARGSQGTQGSQTDESGQFGRGTR